MQIMKRVLVCLEHGELDGQLLQYASMMAETLQSQRVFFIHILTGKEKEKDPFQDNGSAEKDIEQKLTKTIEKHFTAAIQKDIVVKDGNSVKKILRFANLNRIDLIIMGKKPIEESRKAHTAQVTNAARCSVLLVPRKAKISLNKMMIPIDFSNSAKMAMDKAMQIQQNNKAEVVLQHVYFVPSGYHASGKTYEEFAKIVEKNAGNEYRKFMKAGGFNVDSQPMLYTLDDDNKPSDRIYKISEEQGAELIVLASRGRTKMAALLLGSTAVGLIKYNDAIPYLIVKDKRESMGVFEALGRI